MKIPRYWAHGEARGHDRSGKAVGFTCWHWSDTSYDEALAKANVRAAEIVAKYATGADLNRYPYGVRPMREEIVQVVADRRGEQAAVVTRNGYGALVLNTPRAMFMDIDLGEERTTLRNRAAGFFTRLFGTKKPPQDAGVLAEPGLEEVQRWAELHRDLSLRVYRTRAGLRLLVTSHTFNPTDPRVNEMMVELNCDPLYIRLCKAQECFRARLTPKPWRCGVKNPPSTFPFESDGLAAIYRQWLEDYNRACAPFAICRLVTAIGSSVHPEVAPLLELHDKYCCINEGCKLA